MSIATESSMLRTPAVNDRALAELCRLMEQEIPRLAPDAIWLSGNASVFEHLRGIQALTLANDLASDLLCHECGVETFGPQANTENELNTPYRGYCPECGWIALTSEQARHWQAQPMKIARWLSAALRLAHRYEPETLIEGVLWRLGETEYRRRRRTLFFGRRWRSRQTLLLKNWSNS